MSKIKYTEKIRNKAIELRLGGKSSTEITAETGMKKESLSKLFKEKDIKLTEEQAAEARARRWLDHEPVVDGKKICSKCKEPKFLNEFHSNKNTITGVVSACKECAKNYYDENSEEIKERVRIYSINNPEKKKDSANKYYLNNKATKIDNAAKWVKNNPEKRKEIQHKYDKRTQPRKNARTAMYRARKLQATPPWLSQQQIDEIRRIYENCPPGYHVDHIMPLNGENSSGLHVPWNLQYLPAIENLKKSNKI